jgi:predicted RNA-binding protein with PIN domain
MMMMILLLLMLTMMTLHSQDEGNTRYLPHMMPSTAFVLDSSMPSYSTATRTTATTPTTKTKSWLQKSSIRFSQHLLVLMMAKRDGKRSRKPIISSSSSSSSQSSLSSPTVRRLSSTTTTMATVSPRRRSSNKATTGISASPAPPVTSVPVSGVPPPPPPRVSNQINVPVRQQIKWAQLNKEYQRTQSNSAFRANNNHHHRNKKVERTSYRRTWEEDEMEAAAAQRRLKGQDPDWDIILNRTAISPLVIVDGYNIIHKWSRLKKHMNNGDVARARQFLLDDLENLQCLKGWRIEVVFDGARRAVGSPLGIQPGEYSSSSSSTADGGNVIVHGNSANRRLHQQNTIDVTKNGVRTVYTGAGVEADSYIERRCAMAKNVTHGQLTGSLIVATDDTLIRIAGHNAGALCMSADRFVNELKAVKKAVSDRVEMAVAKVNGHAIRPEKLRKRMPSAITRFGRGSVLVDNKQERKQTHRDRRLKELELLSSSVNYYNRDRINITTSTTTLER